MLQTPTAPSVKGVVYNSEGSDDKPLEDIVQMPTLQVGSFSEADVSVHEAGNQFPSRIGLDFLRRFMVVLDFTHSRMILQRRTDYDRCFFRPGFLGIHLKSKGNEFYVDSLSSSIQTGSSGLQVGDRIAEVDQHSLQPLSLAQAQQLLDGFAGQPALVSVQHSTGRYDTVRLVRADLFHGYRNATLGVLFDWVQGHLLVWQAQPTGPLCKELKWNDEVIELNGLAVVGLTVHQVLSLLNEEALALRVWRSSDETWRDIHIAAVSTRFDPPPPQVIVGPPATGYHWRFTQKDGWMTTAN